MYRPVVWLGILFTLVNAEQQTEGTELECSSKSSSTTLARLRGNLFCDYDPAIRPVNDHRDATIVSIGLMLKYFTYNCYRSFISRSRMCLLMREIFDKVIPSRRRGKFSINKNMSKTEKKIIGNYFCCVGDSDHFSHMLSVDAWFKAFWIDQHLKWKPEDYDGIKTVKLESSYDLWVPDISIHNRWDQSADPRAIGDSFCTVDYLGNVSCVPSLHFDALCVPDLKRYPYDVQKCTVRFGSLVDKLEEVNLRLDNPLVDMEDLVSNGEWKLLSAKGVKHLGNYAFSPTSTFPSVDITFEIQRYSSAHAIDVVLPLLVCILLTVVTMMMSPLNKDRLVLCCVNFLAHIWHVQNLSYSVPMNGESLPNLYRISRDSSLLVGVSIIATIFLKYLMRNKTISPGWISGTVSILIGSRPGQFILLSDNSLKGTAKSEHQEDGETIISNSGSLSDPTSGDWLIFGKFLDILLLIIYLVTYFILLVSF